MIRFLPQRGVKSPLYLPAEHELPPQGDVVCLGFDFGGQVSASLTTEQSEQVPRDFLLTQICAHTDAAGGGFFLHLLHQHGQVQREIMNKLLAVDLVAGRGGSGLILREPYLLAAGDTLTAAIANTGNDGVQHYNFTAANIHVACWGVYL